MSILDNILKTIKENGMNEQDLCRLLKLSKSGVYSWKKQGAEPSATQIATIAKHLNITTDYLLGLSETPRQEKTALTFNEIKLIEAYRAKPEMHIAVQKLLEIYVETKEEPQKEAN